MNRFKRSHLSDSALLNSAQTHVTTERNATADLLADIAEIDSRKLFLPAGYPTMFDYCVGRLRLSEDSAAKRLHAARAAQRFPVIFEALADGRLHLSAVCMLAPHLTESTAAELLEAAMGKTKAQIADVLATRFPKSEVFSWVAGPTATGRLAESPVPAHAPSFEPKAKSHAPGHVNYIPVPAAMPVVPRVEPLAAQSFAVQFTIGKADHELLRQAQDLLGHQVAGADIGEVFRRALRAYVPQLEKAKFAATSRPIRRLVRESKNPRHVRAHVKRAVWERDGGRCTFVSESGHRCEARRGLQFDHVLEVARGGEATADNIRLRCRGHNQYAAEQTFGAEFMRHKRIAASEARSSVRPMDSPRPTG